MNEDTDIAIVGIGCMFPGAENLDEFWKVLVNGEDHVQDIPPERFNAQAFYDPDPDHPHKTYVRKAGLIQRYDEWDNRFFGISDKEAEDVDPQQHFVLESVHMALEDAGIPRETIAGSNTGVYIGAMNHDWDCVLRSARHKSTNTTVTGTDSSILSARVAYFYNLLGPAITMNTACSSAMVAFHTASQALRNGEISMAIAGGVSFILDPEVLIHLSSARMASPTGKCHTFSKDADGYARGEGCGIVLMKRFADAVRDNNKIWGTLFTGLNQDGHMSSPITSPSGDQQEILLHTVFEKCRIPPLHVQYIEAHGTGTSVGDFTEVSALGKFFSKHVIHDIPIGSVKSNIGHLESGAGAAALIKVLLMMKNQKMVPSIHAEPLNHRIPFNELKLHVCQKQSSWCPNDNKRRIASINCFGFGGTNAHAIVIGYEKTKNPPTHSCLQTCLKLKKYIILSAEDLIALTNSARNLLKYLEDGISLIDLSSTTVHTRSHYRFRKVFVVEEIQDLALQIEQFMKEKNQVKPVGKEKPELVFVYCGVGTTWQKMCKNLIQLDEIFKKSIKDIDKHLSFYADISVEAIFENEEDVSDPLKNHLAIFACQIGLTEMWRHLGVSPDSIVGQSVGEVAAAYASNILSLEDAVKVIYFRSLNLSQESSGKMIVIQNCDVKIIDDKCKHLKNGQANVAVYHSPVSCAVSGDASAIEELRTNLSDQPVKIVPLNVKCAYHSHLTKTASLKLEENLKGLEYKNSTTTVISTVTGKDANDSFGSARYWAENVSKPVLFHQAIKETKQKLGNVIFLEIGPTAVLKAHLQNIFPDTSEEALPSMKRKSEIETFQKTFLDLFGKGIPVLWNNVVPLTNNILNIPRYPFSKRKHLSTSENIKKILTGYQNSENDMLSSRVPGNGDQFSIMISRDNTPFVYHHVVDENTVVPGALYGEIALEIGNALVQGNRNSDLDVSWSIHRALLIKEDEQSIVVKTKQERKHEISFEAFASGTTSPLSSGKVSLAVPPRSCDTNVSRMLSILETDGDSFITYLALKNIGFRYGPMFQTIKKIAVRDNEIFCDVFIPDTVIKDVQRTYLHPVVLDTMFQSCFGTRLKDNELLKEKILPVKVSHLVARQRPRQSMICYTTLINESATNASFDILLLQDSGSIIAEIRGFEVEKINSLDSIRSISYYESWKVTELPMQPAITESVSKKNICVLSWNAEYLSLIKNAFYKTQENVNVYQTLLTEATIPDLNSIKNQTSMEHVSLIFAPGLTGLGEETTGDKLLELVTQITTVFLTLLKALYEKNMHIIVATNETQPCSSGKLGIIGAELWGMVRAVSHEGTKLSFTLLDIDNPTDFVLDSLVRVSTVFGQNSRHIPCEYAIRGYVFYKSDLLKLPEAFHTCSMKNSSQTSEPVSIHHYINQGKDKYFGLPSSEEVPPEHLNHICVSPMETLMCNAENISAYGCHSEFDNSNLIIPEKEVKIFEVVGKARIGKNDIEVVACCHTVLKTQIKVDRKNVFAKSKLKNYKTGYLHSAIISQAIAEHIKKKATVVVECCKEHLIIYSFLRLLLKKHNCTVLFRDPSIDKGTQNTLATDIIILKNSGYIEEASLQIQYPNGQRCISLMGTVSFSMQNGNSQFKFNKVDVTELYRPSYLRQASEKAYRFLVSVLNQYHDLNVYKNECVLDVTQITKHLEIRTSEEFLIRGDSAYVVVGGLTGLGWLIIKYLAKRKAKKIISLSRRSPSSEAKQRILNVQNIHNVEIIHREVDITNLKNLKNVVHSIQKMIPDIPIRGVFQGAGVVKDNTVPKMTQKEFDLPLTVKILGTWNLHLATRNMNLDIFMMHSSVASVFGNYCQTNYAAGNAFEDSFAHYRKSLGLPAQTINWGALEVGMGSDPRLKDIFFHKGINLMSEGQICRCLTQMLLSDRTQAIFVDFDIRRFLTANNFKWQNSKYAGIVPSENGLPSDIPEVKHSVDNDEDMTDLVKEVSAQVLLLDISELTDTNTLAQFGLDSQNGIEIINTIYSRTKVRVPILMLLSNGFTIRELGEFIQEKLEQNTSGKIHTSGSDNNAESLTFRDNFKCIQDKNVNLDFHFEILALMNKPETWRKIVQIMIRMNSSLRVCTVESTDTDSSREAMTSVEDYILPFQVVHQMDLTSQISTRENNTLSVIYEDMHNHAILHIFGNRSHFDGFCGEIILRDLQKISEYVIANQNVPLWFNKLNFDIVSVGSEKLQNINNECHEYWKAHLRLCKTPSSLKAITCTILEKQYQNAVINLPPIDAKCIEDLAQDNGWTMCSLVASAYQIILHQITNAQRIPLIMEVDLRSQFPEFAKQISPCSNFIPIISPNFLPPFTTIQSFLSENDKVVQDGISQSLFPYAIIEELEEFVKEIHHTHFFFFNVVHRDHQYINMRSTGIERNPSFETMLQTRHDPRKHTLELEIHFCPRRVSSPLASIIADYLLCLVQSLPKVSTATLMDLHTRALLDDGGPISLPPGPFVWREQNGNLEPVVLSIKNRTPPILTWASKHFYQTKLSDVKNVSMTKNKDFYELRFQCKQAVVFQTKELHVCRTWWAFLGNLPEQHRNSFVTHPDLEEDVIQNTYL